MKRNRRKPTEIITDELCEYGCGNPAKYIFANGKKCCSTTGGNCPSRRTKAIQSKKITMNKVDENGVNGWERNARKIAMIKTEVGEDGLSSHQRGALKAAATVKNQIMTDGRSLKEHMVENAHKTMNETIMEDGRTLREHLKELQSESMRRLNDDGLTEAQRRSSISCETKRSSIDENGLNTFDRAALKFKGTSYFRGSKHFYTQSSHEVLFLDQLCANNNMTVNELEHHVKRGPTIHYNFLGKKHWYVSDFIINNTIYEIKSFYTWNVDEERNKAKLQAAIEVGYEVVLVIDGIFYHYPNLSPAPSNIILR